MKTGLMIARSIAWNAWTKCGVDPAEARHDRVGVEAEQARLISHGVTVAAVDPGANP